MSSATTESGDVRKTSIRFATESDDIQNELLQNIISMLNDHAEHCRKSGDYIEAMVAEERKGQLVTHEQRLKNAELTRAQKEELEKLEATNKAELKILTALWDDRLNEFERLATEILQEFKSGQDKEFKEYQNRLRYHTFKEKIKPTKELTNLRRIEQALVSQRSYIEAQRVKIKADSVEKSMRDTKPEGAMADRLVELEGKFQKRQNEHKQALLDRIEDIRRQQHELKSFEFANLNQRFHNINREIESRHVVEQRKASGSSPE